MACSNEKCWFRFLCDVKSTEEIDIKSCDRYNVIAGWWVQKLSGVRDMDDEEDE